MDKISYSTCFFSMFLKQNIVVNMKYRLLYFFICISLIFQEKTKSSLIIYNKSNSMFGRKSTSHVLLIKICPWEHYFEF